MHRVAAAALAASLCSFSTAQAADQIGTITAAIDGAERTWNTLQATPDEATVTFYKRSAFSNLSLQGHDPALGLMQDVLSLDMTWMSGSMDAGPPALVDMYFLPTGMRPPYWTSEELPEQPQVTFSRIELGQTTGRAEGSFSGMVCRSDGAGKDPDMSDCKLISGTFATDLLVVDEN